MKLYYELSKLAINDLESIWNYTAEQWSVEQANSYYRLIFEVIDSICIDPQIGKSIKEVKKNHRAKIAKSHLVIYKIEGESIKIDRILHQKMDIESQLSE